MILPNLELTSSLSCIGRSRLAPQAFKLFTLVLAFKAWPYSNHQYFPQGAIHINLQHYIAVLKKTATTEASGINVRLGD